MNSTVQNPEKVGNALKTLAAYLRSSKVDLEELGETGEMIAETTPKLQEKMTALTHGAVQILERDGKTIRSTYAIMKDLSKIWDTGFLSDVDQAAVLEMIAGKRQSSTVASLLQNFETAEEVMNRIAGNNAMGSALEENSKYLESINGKIAQFDAAFEKLSADIMGSDLVKGYYEFWTGIVNGIDSVVSAANGLSGIIPTLSTVAGLFIGGTTNSNPVTWIRSLHTMFAGSGELIANIRDAEPIIQHYNTLLKDGAEEAIKYADSLADEFGDEGLTKYLQGRKGGIATMDGFIASLKEAGVSTAALTVRTVALRAAQMALNAAITAFISFAISFVISKIGKAIEDYNNRLDIAVEKTEKMNAEWEEFEKTNAANIKTVKDMADEFETLAEGVDKNGKNISLTSDEYERYLQLVDTLVGIAPTLVQGYDDEKNAIIKKNDAIQETIDLLEKEYKFELRNRVAPSNMATQLGGYTAGYRQAEIARNEAQTAYGQAATKFLLGGYEGSAFLGAQSYIGETTAKELLQKLNVTDVALDKYFQLATRQTSTSYEVTKEFNGAQFAADLMDIVMKKINRIDPTSLGYNDFYEMQRAYESVVAAQSDIAAKQKEMSDMLQTSSEALYDVARTYDGWDKLSETTQNAVFSLIDSYTNDISVLAERKINGDWVVTEEKVTQAEAHIDRMIAKLIDDGVEKAVETINGLTEQYQAGQVSEEDYKYQSSNILRDLVDKHAPKQIVLSLKAVVDDAMLEKELKEAADNLSEKAQAIFDSLNPDENGFAAAFDFSEAITNLDTLGKGFSDLADAILQVRDGTMLTEQEITGLIAKYPELVEAGNLYAADTIEGQQAILEHFMQTKEAEYDAEIQTNVARLTAQQSLLEQQVAAEDAKLAAIANMREQMNEASLKNSQAYQEALDEINEIGAENFATIKDGEVVYNADALSRMLESDTDYASKSEENAWEPHSDDIADDLDAAYSAATAMLDEMLTAETNALESYRLNTLIPFSNDVAKALIGEEPTGGYNSGYGASSNYTKIDPRHKGTTAKLNEAEILAREGYTVIPEIDKSVYDAVNAKVNIYLDASERIAQQNKKIYQAEIESIKNQISTLNSLRGLDLPTVYGKAPTASKSSTPKSSKEKSGSSTKEKTVEEYKADIDAYYAAEKKLAEAQFKRAQLERQLDDTTDLKEKIEIERQLIDVYKEESDAQAELLRLKEETIGQNVRALQQLGFEVEYNEATNQLYISNLEHLNELVADSKGDYETIEEATNELRKTTETLIDNTEKLAGECGTASDAMYDLAKDTEAAKAQIIEYLNEMVGKANEVVDGFQGIYDTFTKAAREFSSTGYLSIDSLQAILQLGPKYLQLLYDEAGQLQVNKERIQDIIAARSSEMAVQTAYSHVMQIIEALNDDDDDALRELVKVTKEFTDETWGSVYALAAQADTLAKLKGKSDMFEFSVTDQVRQIESMYQTMISSMDEYWESVEDGYITQKDALQDVIDATIDYIKWENEQKSDALEKEKDDYKDIIDSRKEALRLAKEEDKRNADTEDKLREIAKLQRKIDQLSLDDSREARAQRASLEEQLYQLQRDIQGQQSEESISAAEDALDAQYEAFSEEKDKEIDAFQKETQSYQKLWDQAIARLENDWQGMYQKILDWNNDYGNDLNKNIIQKWEQAIKAVERYGSVTDALEGTASDTYIGDYSTPEYAKYEQAVMATAKAAAESMKANSIAWLTADKDTRKSLEKRNEELGYGAGMTKVNGAWYLPNGERAYKLTAAEYTAPIMGKIASDTVAMALTKDEAERKRLQKEIDFLKKTLEEMKAMESFHTGGYVGGNSSLKQDEVMAVLQKGEAVLDKQKENALYKLVDFASLLQKKLGTSINTGLLGMLTRAATPSIPTATAYAANAAGGMNFAPTITVEINHSGSLSEADARRYGDIAADAALDKLSDAFGRRGITSFGGALLKGAQA